MRTAKQIEQIKERRESTERQREYVHERYNRIKIMRTEKQSKKVLPMRDKANAQSDPKSPRGRIRAAISAGMSPLQAQAIQEP